MLIVSGQPGIWALDSVQNGGVGASCRAEAHRRPGKPEQNVTGATRDFCERVYTGWCM